MASFRGTRSAFLTARGAPPPRALARRLRASLGPQALLILLLGAFPAIGQPGPPSQVIKWSATPPAAPVRAGGTTTLTVVADIQPAWHLYALTQPKGGPVPLEIRAAKGQPFQVHTAKIAAPTPKSSADENFKLETRYYDTRTTFTVPIAVATSATKGPQMLALEVRYQACSDTICLRPATYTLQVPVTVSAKP